jgi:DNA-binding NarL/FixJ family response regulator
MCSLVSIIALDTNYNYIANIHFDIFIHHIMITVALADDNNLHRKGLKAYLHLLNDIEILFVAKNGEDSLDQLQAQIKLPDIILMDFKMSPGPDGVQTTKAVRSQKISDH